MVRRLASLVGMLMVAFFGSEASWAATAVEREAEIKAEAPDGAQSKFIVSSDEAKAVSVDATGVESVYKRDGSPATSYTIKGDVGTLVQAIDTVFSTINAVSQQGLTKEEQGAVNSALIKNGCVPPSPTSVP